jgi:hypothetical protein
MDDQHRAVMVGDSPERVSPHGGDNGLVGHPRRRAQPVQRFQVGRGRQLIGQVVAAGMTTHLVERRDQTRGATPIAQLGMSEHGLTQTIRRRARRVFRHAGHDVCRPAARNVGRESAARAVAERH